MEEKRYQKAYGRLLEYLHSEYAEKIIYAMAGFFSGMIASRGLVFGKYAPFGVATAAAMPKKGMWGALFGAFFGYLFPSPTSVPARYVAALIAVAAIRWSLSELRAINSHPLFAPLTTFTPLLLTGVVMVVINGSMEYSAVLYVAEAFLAGGSAFFLTKAGEFIISTKKDIVYDNMDVASLMITSCIMILSLSDITINGISIGRILTVLLVLYSARMGGISAGAIAGVAAGTIQGLSVMGLSYLSGAYGLGGLMAGVFAPMGKIATAVAFIIAHGVASLQVGDGQPVLIGAIEVAAATILYMALPKSRRITQLFNVRKDTLSGSALRNNVVMRLRHASEALKGVYSSVDEVSRKLAVISAPDIQGVYNSSTERICAGCSKGVLCWGKYKAETIDNFGSLTRIIKEKDRIEMTDFRQDFQERCVRAGEMRQEVNKNYGRYMAREAARLKASQIREVVEAHFQTTAEVLSEMAEEFTMYEHFDSEAAGRVSDILKDNGIAPIEVCCRIDKFDRMTVEAEVEKRRQKKLNRAVFTKEISAACGRNFSPPSVSVAEDSCLIQMCQRPYFDVMRGFSQYNANNNSFCGDCAAAFYDGSGRLIAMISDGMGTGGHAAVDGAMAVAMSESLLKAGIGFDSMLQTLNAALMAKSGEESLATLDIVSIDLFTGETELRKAGAAGTVIKRSKRTEYIELSSMPAGIFPDISFVEERRTLDSGDMIVMVSDGVVAGGSEWLVDLVDNVDSDVDPNLMAEQIIDKARERRTDGHEDDVSVLILVLV